MALTSGQKTWLDAQVGQPRALSVEGVRTRLEMDGKDHVYIVEFEDGGDATQRWAYPAEPLDADAELNQRVNIGIDGTVTEWRGISEDDVALHVVAENGDDAWVSLDEVPRSQAELDAEAAAAEAERKKQEDARAAQDAERQTVIDRVTVLKNKGTARTATDTANLLNDLATLALGSTGAQPAPPAPARP